MVSKIIGGRDSIKFLKDLFQIGDDLPVRSIVLTAAFDEATTLDIEAFAQLKDIDIKTDILNQDKVTNKTKYTVTIEKIGE